jgi:hypothetical protein
MWVSNRLTRFRLAFGDRTTTLNPFVAICWPDPGGAVAFVLALCEVDSSSPCYTACSLFLFHSSPPAGDSLRTRLFHEELCLTWS